jgi:large subunit ribosomal protein L15
MELKRVKTIKPSKRPGRGYGSGKGGHTASRGQKGQKSRSHVNIMYEGVKMRKSLLNRLPLMRGKGRNQSGDKPIVISLSQLNELPAGTQVTLEKVVEANIVRADAALSRGVKVLATGEITKKLTVAIPTSKSAAEKIQSAGGTIQEA